MCSPPPHQIAEAAKLPPHEQDRMANEILEELRFEGQWQHQLQNSQDLLESLADEALEEHRLGKTQDLDPSQ